MHMNHPTDQIELTDSELAQIEGGGFWSKLAAGLGLGAAIISFILAL